MKISLIVIFLALFLTIKAQNINPEYFNKIVFNSDFKSAKDMKIWPLANDEEELLIISNGQYIIERKDAFKDKMIFPNWQNPYPNFEILASFSLEKFQFPYQTAGVCFNFNKSQEEGIIIEFNKNKQFRIKKLGNSGNIEYISGPNAQKSWKKCNYLLTNDQTNDLNIMVIGKNIEIFINNFFVFSFENECSYPLRNFGIFVGKSSHVIFSKFQLLVNHRELGKYDHLLSQVTEEENISTPGNNNYQDKKSKDSIIAKTGNNQHNVTESKELSEALSLIIKLKNDLSSTQKELETYKQLLEKCKNDNINLNTFIENNLDSKSLSRITELEKENSRLKDQIQKLKTENATLQDFKSFYLNQNKDKDIINFLYDELKKLEEKNASLNRQIEILQNQLKTQKK